MRAILAAALVFGLGGPATAKDDKADPSGTWKLEYNIVDMKREATLSIKKDGDKLAGMMVYQDKQEAKLKDPAFKDGVLTFSTVRKLKDMELTIEYKLTVDGDKIKGKGAVEVGTEKRDFDIEGKREKK
jgi:hypothetical protein